MIKLWIHWKLQVPNITNHSICFCHCQACRLVRKLVGWVGKTKLFRENFKWNSKICRKKCQKKRVIFLCTVCGTHCLFSRIMLPIATWFWDCIMEYLHVGLIQSMKLPADTVSCSCYPLCHSDHRDCPCADTFVSSQSPWHPLQWHSAIYDLHSHLTVVWRSSRKCSLWSERQSETEKTSYIHKHTVGEEVSQVWN